MRSLRPKPTTSAPPGNPPGAPASAPAAPAQETPQTGRRSRLWRWVAGAGVLVLVVAVGAFLLLYRPKKEGKDTVGVGESGVRIVAGQPDALEVSDTTARGLGLRTAAAVPAKDLRPIHMYGQLAPNLDRLIRLKPKFSGRVTEVAQVHVIENGRSAFRPITTGDHVDPNQVLCVIISTDLGQTKSTLVDAWSQYLTDHKQLEQLEAHPSSVPLKSIQDMKRAVDKDRIAADAAANTLRGWGIGNDVIDALKEEARKGGNRDPTRWQRWARYELRAPKNWGGTIVEKNATEDENIDPSNGPPLFQVADYSTLWVYAYPYEEDLPVLLDIKNHQGAIPWTVVPKADLGVKFTGTVDDILPVIDPNMKTPILRGHVENPKRILLSQMSVTCTVQVPAPAGEVVIPATAVLDSGEEPIVFVQPDPTKPVYRRQYVDVLRRYADSAFVRARPAPRHAKGTAEKSGEPSVVEPLKPGQRVVTSGAIELNSTLEDLQSQGPANITSQK